MNDNTHAVGIVEDPKMLLANRKPPQWAKHQLTKEEAIAFHDSKAWELLKLDEVFVFAIPQERLCVPWDLLHEATEFTLGRPVWTHEFADQGRLIEEYDQRYGPLELKHAVYLTAKVATAMWLMQPRMMGEEAGLKLLALLDRLEAIVAHPCSHLIWDDIRAAHESVFATADEFVAWAHQAIKQREEMTDEEDRDRSTCERP